MFQKDPHLRHIYALIVYSIRFIDQHKPADLKLYCVISINEKACLKKPHTAVIYLVFNSHYFHNNHYQISLSSLFLVIPFHTNVTE